MSKSSPNYKFALPILKGPLGGMWWSPASGGKIARVFLGSYELEQTSLMSLSIGAGDTFVDIGAHHGYYTLMASRRVGAKGKVLAFEPDPVNYHLLEKHTTWNKLKNVELMEAAVGSENGTLKFSKGTGTGTGHLADDGDIEVSVVRLDDEVAQRKLKPTHLKIDVEGAELQVLEGATQTLKTCQPAIFLSTHGPEVHAACCDYLKWLDFALTPILGDDLENTTEVFAQPKAIADRMAA